MKWIKAIFQKKEEPKTEEIKPEPAPTVLMTESAPTEADILKSILQLHALPGAMKPLDLCVVKNRDEIKSHMIKNIEDARKQCAQNSWNPSDAVILWPKQFHEIAETLPVELATDKYPMFLGQELEGWKILSMQ